MTWYISAVMNMIAEKTPLDAVTQNELIKSFEEMDEKLILDLYGEDDVSIPIETMLHTVINFKRRLDQSKSFYIMQIYDMFAASLVTSFKADNDNTLYLVDFLHTLALFYQSNDFELIDEELKKKGFSLNSFKNKNFVNEHPQQTTYFFELLKKSSIFMRLANEEKIHIDALDGDLGLLKPMHELIDAVRPYLNEEDKLELYEDLIDFTRSSLKDAAKNNPSSAINLILTIISELTAGALTNLIASIDNIQDLDALLTLLKHKKFNFLRQESDPTLFGTNAPTRWEELIEQMQEIALKLAKPDGKLQKNLNLYQAIFQENIDTSYLDEFNSVLAVKNIEPPSLDPTKSLKK